MLNTNAMLLLLSPAFTRDSAMLTQAARDAEWRVQRVKDWQVPVGLDDPAIAYYGFLRAPLAALLMEALSRVLLQPTPGWLPRLPPQYRKREVYLTTLEESRCGTDPIFLKPAAGKDFPAGIYPSRRLPHFAADLPPDLPVLTAEPVAWEHEYRCFVCERCVTTLAPYGPGPMRQIAGGSVTQREQEALAFVRSLLEDPVVALPPAVVVDIGRIEGRGWAVVEANPAWASALYGCVPARVLPVLQRACVLSSALTPDDRTWLLQHDPANAPPIRG